MCLALFTKAFKPGRIDINICVLTEPCKQFSGRYHAQKILNNCLIARHKQCHVVISIMISVMQLLLLCMVVVKV